MTRAVIDPNVLVAAVLAPNGAPADCLRAHAEGRFELVASERLFGELATVLAREKFRRYLSVEQARRFVTALRRDALLHPDPSEPPPIACRDPDDAYLLALALAAEAHVLVSGDAHLLELCPPHLHIASPREFLARLPA